MDSDGYLDILVANRDQPNQVLYNDGAGSFSKDVTSFPGANYGSFDIKCADLDKDGYMDVAVSNAFGKGQIFYGAGSRILEDPVDIQNDYAIKPVGTSLSIGDIDGDGYDDIIMGES